MKWRDPHWQSIPEQESIDFACSKPLGTLWTAEIYSEPSPNPNCNAELRSNQISKQPENETK